jgi:hypothetical protein
VCIVWDDESAQPSTFSCAPPKAHFEGWSTFDDRVTICPNNHEAVTEHGKQRLSGSLFRNKMLLQFEQRFEFIEPHIAPKQEGNGKANERADYSAWHGGIRFF